MIWLPKCERCGRPVRQPLLDWLLGLPVLCPPVEVCDRVPPDDREPPYPDPVEESRPVDIGVCSSCHGYGEVLLVLPGGAVLKDYETGAPHTRECGACGGTGDADGLHPVYSPVKLVPGVG